MSSKNPDASSEEVVALLVLQFGQPIVHQLLSLLSDEASKQYNDVTMFLYRMGYDNVGVNELRKAYYHTFGLNSGSPIDAPERRGY